MKYKKITPDSTILFVFHKKQNKQPYDSKGESFLIPDRKSLEELLGKV